MHFCKKTFLYKSFNSELTKKDKFRLSLQPSRRGISPTNPTLNSKPFNQLIRLHNCRQSTYRTSNLISFSQTFYTFKPIESRRVIYALLQSACIVFHPYQLFLNQPVAAHISLYSISLLPMLTQSNSTYAVQLA